MVSDETAYRKYLAGDEAAAQLLVERYGDALTLYINGVLGDIHEAEDLMIEAFAHIFARERPIQDGCFKAYLYKTGRNLALRCKTRRRFFCRWRNCLLNCRTRHWPKPGCSRTNSTSSCTPHWASSKRNTGRHFFWSILKN